MHSMSRQQALYYVESIQLLEAWYAAADKLAANYSGSMKWLKSGGHEYLVKVRNSKGDGVSLGRRSPETEAIYNAFQEGKARASLAYTQVNEQLQLQTRLNKAARMGRMPNVAAKILLALRVIDATKDFRVVGTHAMYAYEAMAGVYIEPDLLASGDIDMLFDSRKRISVVAGKLNSIHSGGLLALLRTADKSFEIMGQGSFRAVNSSGFMVDLITDIQDINRTKKITFSENDLVAAEVSGLQWLCNAPSVQATVIAESGQPLLVNAPDPRAFAIHKAWLSGATGREPVKKLRDLAQSELLVEIINQHLPQYPFESEHLRYMPKWLVDRTQTKLSAQELDGTPLRNFRP